MHSLIDWIGKRIMVIVAHPDDEVLGCGALLYELARMNASVKIVVLSHGYDDSNDENYRVVKHKDLLRACQQISPLIEVEMLDYDGGFLDRYPKSVINAHVSKLVSHYEPTTVLTHHWGDVNYDHRVVFDSVMVASRPHRINEKRIRNILAMEILSSSDWNGLVGEGGFNPNLFVKVSEDAIKSKAAAFAHYSTEQFNEPHPRSKEGIINLAKYRGNSMNMTFAEAFVQIRTII